MSGRSTVAVPLSKTLPWPSLALGFWNFSLNIVVTPKTMVAVTIATRPPITHNTKSHLFQLRRRDHMRWCGEAVVVEGDEGAETVMPLLVAKGRSVRSDAWVTSPYSLRLPPTHCRYQRLQL